MKVKKLGDRYWRISFSEAEEPFVWNLTGRMHLHPAVRRVFNRASLFSCIGEGGQLNCYVQYMGDSRADIEMVRFERIITMAQIMGLAAFTEADEWL